MATTIKVNNIQNQCGANIANKCGSPITLGASGDTITLACGASQTGFGRTGTVDWDTTAKTAGFTAVSGTGYFVNTTSGAITMNLPASPSAGDIVSIKDYAYTFGTNNFIVDGNGSPIGGTAGSIPVTYSTNGTSKTFIYVDGTKGWLVTNESTDTSQESSPVYVAATGGTITTCGDYKIHTFTGPGTFTVTCAGNACGSNTVDYLVVAGGGGGGSGNNNNTTGAGGAGAGGLRISASTYSCGSPLVSPTGLPVTVTGYPITVGAGGAGGAAGGSVFCLVGFPGNNSIFSSVTATAGGFGATGYQPPISLQIGGPGGSGGGSGGSCSGNGGAGTGNTPPVSPPQGNPGGTNLSCNAASGGGAGAAGGNGQPPGSAPGAPAANPGGIGSYIPNTALGPTAPSYGTPGPVGSTRYFAGGGGAGASAYTSTTGALGGAGGGGNGGSYPAGAGSAGTTNTGGGGGAGGTNSGSVGGAGGSGIVIIRYKYQ